MKATPATDSLLTCPVCNVDFPYAESRSRPFCSKRCKQIDLGKWLNEEYKIPNYPEDFDDEPFH